MKKLFTILCFLMILVLGFGCGSDIEGITITSDNNVRTIKVNETLQLTAKVFPENANQDVKWSSAEEKTATVNDNGLVTALAVGNVEIYAQSVANEEIKQSFSIIIEEAEKQVINPESITITSLNDITSCKAGETITLYAAVTPSDANQSVNWSSSDETIATVSRGVVTALKAGEVIITATSKEDENISNTIKLTIIKSDDPVLTKDWENIDYITHENYYSCDNDTPIKVKGKVTHVSPVSDGKVTYLIQNGKDGYYIYKQDATVFPVELGKVYEVGGLKKNYQGLNEIVNVEYFKELDEKIDYEINNIDGVDTTSLDAVSVYHCSLVTAKAVLTSVSVNEAKAYSFYGTIGSYSVTFRVDPSYMNSEEFAKINLILSTALTGSEFTFTGFMSAFGYGKPSPQIMILNSKGLEFGELSDEDILNAAANTIKIASSVTMLNNSIELPNSIDKFDGVTIKWSSDSELINCETGAVNHDNKNVVVTLTATIEKGEKNTTKEFKVTVFALDNEEHEVLVSFDLEDALAPGKYDTSDSKSGYAEGTCELGTPKKVWLLRNALIGCADGDIYDGTMSIRAQANKEEAKTARIEIQEDGEYNIVEFAAAIYGNDPTGIQIRVEYSVDSGENWVKCEQVITVDSKTLETFRIELPEGAKRVAIVVVEGSGKRVNIDNIKLMK